MTAAATCVWVILLPIVLLSWVWALPCVFRRWDEDGWGLGGVVVELRTDGGQGGMRRGVRASTCWSAGPWRGSKDMGECTHTLTCVLVHFPRPWKPRRARGALSPTWELLLSHVTVDVKMLSISIRLRTHFSISRGQRRQYSVTIIQFGAETIGRSWGLRW